MKKQKNEKNRNRLVFLGTGGGGYVMFTQARKTGGIYFELGKRFILDPGPGSLVYSQKLGLKPEKWDGMLVSHKHPDHCTDADALIDGMARDRRPFLVAEEHCLEPKDGMYPCISEYHKRISDTRAVKPGERVEIDSMEIAVNKADHYSPTVGFTFFCDNLRVGYASDGAYYKGQEKGYEGCSILILNVLTPKHRRLTKRHMSTEEAIELVNKMKKKPELVIITHFSFWMLRANVWAQAKLLEKATGVKAIPAEDFMELDLETLKTRKLRAK